MSYIVLAEKEAVRFDNLSDFNYTSPFLNALANNKTDYYKTWVGSEQAMLLFRLKELSKYLSNEPEYQELVARLEKANENEEVVDLK